MFGNHARPIYDSVSPHIEEIFSHIDKLAELFSRTKYYDDSFLSQNRIDKLMEAQC